LEKGTLSGKHDVPSIGNIAFPDYDAVLGIFFRFDSAAELSALRIASRKLPEVGPLPYNSNDRIHIRITPFGWVDLQCLKCLIWRSGGASTHRARKWTKYNARPQATLDWPVIHFRGLPGRRSTGRNI
jgi:hypothetical protein